MWIARSSCSGHLQHFAVLQRAKILPGVRHSPEHLVGGMQQNRSVERLAELRRDRHVVVVTVRAHHRHHIAAAHRVDDRARVVGGVDHDDVAIATDQPDVVVDFPTATVEFEGAVRDHAVDAGRHSTTTERRTSPACILWNAVSISPIPMRSDTNFSNGSLPCR